MQLRKIGAFPYKTFFTGLSFELNLFITDSAQLQITWYDKKDKKN